MIKVAVIGVGEMGENHARVYNDIEGAQLVGVTDVNAARVEHVGRRFSVPGFTDHIKMLEELKPDAVSICTPTIMHASSAMKALEAGCHVLVEKPIAHSIEAAKELVVKADECNCQLMVGHIIRFNPAIQSLKQRLDNKELGRIFEIITTRIGPFPTRIHDVGVVVDLATHDLDVMRFLLGLFPLRVYAETEQRIHSDYEDLMSAIVRFPDGVIGTLATNWLTPTKVRGITILGERGMFKVDDLTQDLYFYANDQTEGEMWGALRTLKGVSEGKMIRYAIKREEPLRAELRSFISALNQNMPVPINGQDGLDALCLAMDLIHSAKTHQVVTPTRK